VLNTSHEHVNDHICSPWSRLRFAWRAVHIDPVEALRHEWDVDGDRLSRTRSIRIRERL